VAPFFRRAVAFGRSRRLQISAHPPEYGAERLAGGYSHPTSGIAGVVPSSLGNNVHIEEVLRAADEIQDEDPTVARIRK
jgi:hypothetical protein